MKLPNGDEAIIDAAKLANYCLDPTHPYGSHKATVFLAALGLTRAHATELRKALLTAASTGEAKPGKPNRYGWIFVIDFQMTRDDRQATVRSSWIIRFGELRPRLVTCFVL